MALMKYRKVKLAFAGFFALMVAFSGYYLILSFTSPEREVVSRVVGIYTQNGEIGYWAELKPNLIYEKNAIETGEAVYTSLLKNMNLSYRYFIENANNVSGSYRITVLTGTTKEPEWDKEYYTTSGEFKDELKVEIPLNWSQITAQWSKIEKETKYDFGDPTLKILVSIDSEGEVENSKIFSKFNQSAMVTYGKLIKLIGAEKTQVGRVMESKERDSSLDILLATPVPVKDAKFIFAGLVGTSGLGLFTSLYVSRSEIREYFASRSERSFHRKYGKSIIRVSDLKFDRVVKLDELDSVGKLSYELDKPIISFNGNLFILDGDTAYVYSKDVLSKEESKML